MIAPNPAASRWFSSHRLEAALLIALACHVGVLLLPAEGPRAKSTSRARVEVDLVPWELETADSPDTRAEDLAPHEAPARSAAKGAPPSSAPPSAVDQLATEDAPRTEEAPSALPENAPPAPAASGRKGVHLFLGSKDLAELARRSTPRSPPAPAEAPTSVGLLTEGLEALDAEKGLSRSSAAVSACYRAAEMGPDVGTAVLEVRTDARGAVTTVKVVGNATGGWSLVADTLLARLKDTLLRVPNGARGLVTRLRVDRGYLAEDLAARGRTKPGVAIGQDHHAKDYGWDESTQAGTSRGRLSPSLGVSSEQLGKRVKTRVLLLSQQPL